MKSPVPPDGRSSTGNAMSNPISKIRGAPKDFGGSGGGASATAVKMNPAGGGTGGTGGATKGPNKENIGGGGAVRRSRLDGGGMG